MGLGQGLSATIGALTSARETLERIATNGVVAVLRAPGREVALAAADALVAGGIGVVEVTMTTPDALTIVDRLVARFDADLVVGVGSLRDPEDAGRAQRAGASFLVSPHAEPDLAAAMSATGLTVSIGSAEPDRGGQVGGARQPRREVVPGLAGRARLSLGTARAVPRHRVHADRWRESRQPARVGEGRCARGRCRSRLCCPRPAIEAGDWALIEANARRFRGRVGFGEEPRPPVTGRIVVLGELMMRLSPPAGHHLDEPNQHLDTFFGGSECNTAVACAAMGLEVDVVTSLPPGPMGDAALESLRRMGVGTGAVQRGGRRLGLYFAELASGDRPMTVVYDRAGSSFSEMDPGALDWPSLLDGAGWLHWSGITPALSSATEVTCHLAVSTARAANLPVSCDLNHRPQLWDGVARTRSVMAPLLEACTVVCGNGPALEAMTGIPAPPGAEDEALVTLIDTFASVETAVLTHRVERSSHCHEFSATMWHESAIHRAGHRPSTPSSDRVGGGDAFTAGLLRGLMHRSGEPRALLEFALAACRAKHSVPGDWHGASLDEIEEIRRRTF